MGWCLVCSGNYLGSQSKCSDRTGLAPLAGHKVRQEGRKQPKDSISSKLANTARFRSALHSQREPCSEASGQSVGWGAIGGSFEPSFFGFGGGHVCDRLARACGAAPVGPGDKTNNYWGVGSP